MKATVFYKKGLPGLLGLDQSTKVPKSDYYNMWESQVNNQVFIEALEQIFDRFNMGDHGGLYITRSISVGDIVQLDDKAYMCMPYGWQSISFS